MVMLPHWSLPPTWSRQPYVVEEMEVVVGLEQHVAELGERDPLIWTLQPGPDRLLGHHLVDGEVLADVPQELDDSSSFNHSPLSTNSGRGRHRPLRRSRRRRSSWARMPATLEASSSADRRCAPRSFRRGRRSARCPRRSGRWAGGRPAAGGGGCRPGGDGRRGGCRRWGRTRCRPSACSVSSRFGSDGSVTAGRGPGTRGRSTSEDIGPACHGGTVAPGHSRSGRAQMPPEPPPWTPAVDDEHVPGDPRGGVRRQEQRRLGDVVGLAQPLRGRRSAIPSSARSHRARAKSVRHQARGQRVRPAPRDRARPRAVG